MIIPGFSGGLAKSLYEDLSLQTYQSAIDLAVFNDTRILTPVLPAFTDVALPTQFGTPGDLSGVNFRNYINALGGNYFLGTGVVSSTNYVILYSTGTLDASPSWTKAYGVAGAVSFGGICEYKGSIYFGNGSALIKHTPPSTNATAGTLASSGKFGDIISHKGLGRVFFAHDTAGDAVYSKVGWYDGSTFTEGVLTLGTGLNITNLDQLGKFVLIGVNPVNNSANSYIIVWDGSSSTIEDIIEIGDRGLHAFKNEGGTILALTNNIPTTASNSTKRIYSGGAGGQMQLKKEIFVNTGSTVYSPHGVSVSGNGLYLGLDSGGIYNYNSKDSSMPKFLSNFRNLSVSAQAGGNVSIKSLVDTGTAIVCNWIDSTSGIVHKISTTGGVQATPLTGVYESNIFALNGGLPGKLKRIILNHKAIPASCGFTVQLKQFGNYTWGTSVPTPEIYQDLLTPEGSGSSTGKTQSTDNAFITEITGNELFKTARYAQVKIKFDEAFGTVAPSIIFPLLIETD